MTQNTTTNVPREIPQGNVFMASLRRMDLWLLAAVAALLVWGLVFI